MGPLDDGIMGLRDYLTPDPACCAEAGRLSVSGEVCRLRVSSSCLSTHLTATLTRILLSGSLYSGLVLV
jgi:hypothetical protein